MDFSLVEEEEVAVAAAAAAAGEQAWSLGVVVVVSDVFWVLFFLVPWILWGVVLFPSFAFSEEKEEEEEEGDEIE